jgi:membrane associated rhomboid family serine protease
MTNVINFTKQHIVGFGKFTYTVTAAAVNMFVAVLIIISVPTGIFMGLVKLYPIIGFWTFPIGFILALLCVYVFSEMIDASARKNAALREAQREAERTEHMQQQEIEREQLREEITEELLAK